MFAIHRSSSQAVGTQPPSRCPPRGSSMHILHTGSGSAACMPPLQTLLLRAALPGVMLILHGGAAAHALCETRLGLALENKGESNISQVRIQYGAATRPDCDPFCLPGAAGSGWITDTALQDAMQVSWHTADGRQHQVHVAVKPRVKDASRLRILYLEFRGGELKVIQALDDGGAGLHGFQEFPLYP